MDKQQRKSYCESMGRLGAIKSVIRDALPARWRTPVAAFTQQARGLIEAEIALLPDLIEPGDVAVDVGANHGVYCHALARLGARVEAFEPNPRIAAALTAWAATGANVRVHALALSDRAGTATLAIPCDDQGGLHPASASIAARATANGETVSVETRRLDTFAFKTPRLIKIDVEGHEAAVLMGARRTIAAAAPALLIEIEQRHIDEPIDAAFARVLAFGYQGFFLAGGRLRPLGDFHVDRHQSPNAFAAARGAYCNNFLFLARARLARGEYRRLLQRWAPT